MQTAHGAFRAVLYRDQPSGSPHIALVRGTPSPDQETPVRVHEPLSVLDLLEVGCVHAFVDARRGHEGNRRARSAA